MPSASSVKPSAVGLPVGRCPRCLSPTPVPLWLEGSPFGKRKGGSFPKDCVAVPALGAPCSDIGHPEGWSDRTICLAEAASISRYMAAVLSPGLVSGGTVKGCWQLAQQGQRPTRHPQGEPKSCCWASSPWAPLCPRPSPFFILSSPRTYW